MFFLLLSLKPTNCMVMANLLLYAAVAVYWIFSFIAPAIIVKTDSIAE